MIRKIIRGRVPLQEFNPLKVLGLVRRLLGDVAIHIELVDLGRLRVAPYDTLPEPVRIAGFLLDVDRQVIALQEIGPPFSIATVSVVARGLELP